MQQYHSQPDVGSRRTVWLTLVIALALLGLLSLIKFPGLATVNIRFVQLNHTLGSQSVEDLAQTRSHMESSLIVYPDSSSMLRGRALLLSASAEDEAALQAWRDTPDGTQELRAWAQRAERGRDWSEAARWYGLLLALEPDSAGVWYRYGEVLMQLGRPRAAVNAFQSGLDATAVAKVGASDFLTRLGGLARQGNNPDWALAYEYFGEAIARDVFSVAGNPGTAHMGRAEAADRLGRLDQAMADYRWVAEQQPNNYWAHVHGGRLTWYLDRDAAQATELLRRAVEVDPTNQWAYLNLAQVYAESGQRDLAISLLDQALQSLPENENIQSRLGQLQAGE